MPWHTAVVWVVKETHCHISSSEKWHSGGIFSPLVCYFSSSSPCFEKGNIFSLYFIQGLLLTLNLLTSSATLLRWEILLFHTYILFISGFKLFPDTFPKRNVVSEHRPKYGLVASLCSRIWNSNLADVVLSFHPSQLSELAALWSLNPFSLYFFPLFFRLLKYFIRDVFQEVLSVLFL